MHFDDLETRSSAAREAALLADLPRQIAHALNNAPGFGRILKGVDPAKVTSREALAKLPVTRKSDLVELQNLDPPVGGLNATPLSRLSNVNRWYEVPSASLCLPMVSARSLRIGP